MAALDTNVLVRFLVQDDARQGAAATHLIRGCVETGASLFVPVTVMLELEWVLRSVFGFNKAAVLHSLFSLLGTYELVFESETAVEAALGHYSENAADFADALHTALAALAGHGPLWTFDKSASGLHGARLLAT